MEYLTLLIDAIKYGFLGIFGLVAIVIILTIIFGDQIENKGQYLASFVDDNDNQIGRFRVIIYRYTKKVKPEQLKIKLRLKHSQILPGTMVNVYIEDYLFYEIAATKNGKISFGKSMDKNDFNGDLSRLNNGALCKIKCSGFVLVSAELAKVERMSGLNK